MTKLLGQTLGSLHKVRDNLADFAVSDLEPLLRSLSLLVDDPRWPALAPSLELGVLSHKMALAFVLVGSTAAAWSLDRRVGRALGSYSVAVLRRLPESRDVRQWLTVEEDTELAERSEHALVSEIRSVRTANSSLTLLCCAGATRRRARHAGHRCAGRC